MALAACGGESAAVEDVAAAEWVLMRSDCGYAFEAPPDMTPRRNKDFDSCIDAWSTPTCRYSGDYGCCSDDLTDYRARPEYEASEEVIDGRTAKLVTARSEGFFVAAVTFADLIPKSSTRLTVSARCEDVAGRQDAVRVFRSIDLDEGYSP